MDDLPKEENRRDKAKQSAYGIVVEAKSNERLFEVMPFLQFVSSLAREDKTGKSQDRTITGQSQGNHKTKDKTRKSQDSHKIRQSHKTRQDNHKTR